MKQILSPTIDNLRLECVLVQAWKKTAAYLRTHSWYADTLEIDYQSLRLPKFIAEIQERLEIPETWLPVPLELVPAPKSQRWKLSGTSWEPEGSAEKRIRPLAHVGLQDQVLATAMLLCLANRVETTAGDPRLSLKDESNRRRVLAYGHRLFCDAEAEGLLHRWGNSKLYREYFRDYQTFLERPRFVAERIQSTPGSEVAIVQSDLSKFYDRVRPSLLHEKTRDLSSLPDGDPFLMLFRKLFDWTWRDVKRAGRYGALHDIQGFERVALPQGLVASGFFANIALHDFELGLRDAFGQAIDADGRLILRDACYYVDDIRLVLEIERGLDETLIEEMTMQWLASLLQESAPGLLVDAGKTKAVVEGREKRFLVQQSKTANRIQREASGTFDAHHGTDLIGAIEGFFHTQKRFSSQGKEDTKSRTGLLIGVPDLADDTAARFAAGRYRRTFRSLRPLLPDEEELAGASDSHEDEEEDQPMPSQLVLSKQQLDERGRVFCAMLIDEWVANPGNVRLLRIALDMFPDHDFLDQILILLKPAWSEHGSRGARREVQAYCLAELFRAGATETGMVKDEECLPSGVSVEAYHQRLVEEAKTILVACCEHAFSPTRFPWFLVQQVFLYLAARDAVSDDLLARMKGGETFSLHRKFACFLIGKRIASVEDRAIFAVLASSAFGLTRVLEHSGANPMSPQYLRQLGEMAPKVALNLWNSIRFGAKEGVRQAARSVGLESGAPDLHRFTLADVADHTDKPFFDEDNLLTLAARLLELGTENWPSPLTPWQITCKVNPEEGFPFGRLDSKTVEITGASPRAAHLFAAPDWCDDDEERRRMQLGMILRFVLRGSVDFFAGTRSKNALTARRYRTPVSHWEQQRYAGFQGRSAFGPPWLPISSWVEDLLFDLLRWPGSGITAPVRSLADIGDRIRRRIRILRGRRGKITRVPFLEQEASWPGKPPITWERPLRLGIVQSVLPDVSVFEAHRSDPELVNDPAFRARQRRHLSALMQGVDQMLRIRETHRSAPRNDHRIIDVLIFPELAVHPYDIFPFLLPFVRKQKCLMLFGQVYHPKTDSTDALINSCMWMIPEWRPGSGFQVRMVEQGKQYLTSWERKFVPEPQSFRPAQWLIEYRWSSDVHCRPLRLSASICYDATDIALAADLKSKSDLYIVPALNPDVGTFDRMSEGLHYHMFQGVVVVNNGQFGGSNFFMPYGKPYHRQVLHLHGQPQASIAFVEISPKKLVNRDVPDSGYPEGDWKTPPANWEKAGQS